MSGRIFSWSADGQKVALLIAQSFCTGIFLSHYFTFANGLFVQHFTDAPRYLPFAYIASGLTGALITKFYAVAKKRLHAKGLYRFAFLLISVSALSVWVFYSLFDQPAVAIFISYAFISSFYTLSALQFWGITFRLFNVRSSKRVFGRIGSGGVIASISGFLLVASYHDRPNTILLVGSAGLAIAFFIQQIILKNYFGDEVATPKTAPRKSLRILYKNQLVVFLFGAMALSVFVQYIIDYNFLLGTKEIATQGLLGLDKSDITLLIALIFATAQGMELLLRFLSGRFFKTFGINVVLLFVPFAFLFLFGTIVSMGVAGIHRHSYMLLAVILSKLCERSLRNGLDEPARKLLYQPLDADTRLHAQIYIDGYAKQFSIAFSGLFFIVLHALPLNDVEMSAMMVGLSLLWLWLASGSYRAHTGQLKKFLNARSVALPREITSPGEVKPIEPGTTENLAYKDMEVLNRHIVAGTETAGDEPQQIIREWYAKETDTDLKLKILQLARRLHMRDFMMEAMLLDQFDKRIVSTVLHFLEADEFNYNDTYAQLFYTMINKCLRNIVWLKMLNEDFKGGGKDYDALVGVIENEIFDQYAVLFSFLYLKKNKQDDILIIRHHLINESSYETQLFAIELIDAIFNDGKDQPVKEKLTAIFEDDYAAMKREFLVYRTEAHERLEELLYADLFKIRPETKRMAFRLMCERYYAVYRSGIAGCLFHPDPEIKKLANYRVQEASGLKSKFLTLS